jgi:hypothetical protein
MRKKVFIILGIVILVLIGISFFKKANDAKKLSPGASQGTTLSDNEVENIVKMVRKHIVVPNEKPNVGVVTDITSLIQNEPFYQGAKNGDVLLIYPSISRAILFDLEKDVIINVGPVVFENPEGGPTNQTSTATDTLQE